MIEQKVKSVKSAMRSIQILEYFDKDHPTAKVMEISRYLGYPQSSTSEILKYLCSLGYLYYHKQERVYIPTSRVALIGCWVEPDFFRGGPLLEAIDELSSELGDTVALSTAVNHSVQHVHVIRGRTPGSLAAPPVDISLLHSPQGRLLLSTYSDAQIQGVVHRLNAGLDGVAPPVSRSAFMEDMKALRKRGWIIEPGEERGTGVVSVLMPVHPDRLRLTLSVVTNTELTAENGQYILDRLLDVRTSLSFRANGQCSGREWRPVADDAAWEAMAGGQPPLRLVMSK